MGVNLRALILVYLASVFVCGVATAQNNQVLTGPVPDWVVPSDPVAVPDNVSGLWFMRMHDTLIHIGENGQEQYQGYRVKILHANALQLGNITMSWNPADGAPTVHTLAIHRDGQVIDILANASFDILRREDRLEEQMLDGVLTAVHRISDLRVGDELEVALTIGVNDPTLDGRHANMITMAPSVTSGRFRNGLSWDEKFRPTVQSTPDMDAHKRESETAVDFLFDNPAMVSPPKDAPVRYHWQRLAEFSTFRDWEDVSQTFAPLYLEASKLAKGSPLKKEAARIMKAHKSPLDRASAALTLVQKDVRYIYIGLNGGNLTPATAEETWERRYGDCKGKTTLLLALLEELGIEAEPVLVNSMGTDDGLDQRLPNTQFFDHVLVRAQIDGKTYWMDGTLPPVAAPSLFPVVPHIWVLPLTAQGSTLEQVAWTPPQVPDETNLNEIDARGGFDPVIPMISTSIVRGVAGLQRHMYLSQITFEQMLFSMRQQVGENGWETVDDVQWHYDEEAQASVFVISGTSEADWETNRTGRVKLVLPGGGAYPPRKRARPADQDQEAPYYTKPGFSCYATTVRLPDLTEDTFWWSSSGYNTLIFGSRYFRSFEKRDGTIRMVRSVRTEQKEIDAAVAEADNDRIADFDNGMALIFYSEMFERPLIDDGIRVPATYEIDWVADSSACLSADSTG